MLAVFVAEVSELTAAAPVSALSAADWYRT
jgi:hypothetical protein